MTRLNQFFTFLLSALLVVSLTSKANAGQENLEGVIVGSLIGLAVGLSINDDAPHHIERNTYITHNVHQRPSRHITEFEHRRYQHYNRIHPRFQHHTRYQHYRGEHPRSQHRRNHHSHEQHHYRSSQHHKRIVKQHHKLPREQVTRRIIIEERHGRRINLNDSHY